MSTTNSNNNKQYVSKHNAKRIICGKNNKAKNNAFLEYQFIIILNKTHEYILNIAWKKEGEYREHRLSLKKQKSPFENTGKKSWQIKTNTAGKDV